MIALSEKKKMTQVLLFLVMNLMELFVSELRVYTTSIILRSKKRKITTEAHIRKPYLKGGRGLPGVSQARISNTLSVMEESKANEKRNTKIFIQGKKKLQNPVPTLVVKNEPPSP